MVTLADRLDHVLGRKVSEPLFDAFAMETVEDLLRHYPFRYVSQGQELGQADPVEGEHITVIGTVTKADLVAMRARRGFMLKVVLSCAGQSVAATFFNGHKVKHFIKPGVRVMFSGTVKYFHSTWSLSHPGYLLMDDTDDDLVETGPKVETGVRGGGDLAGMARGAADAAGAVDMTMFDLPFLPMYAATKSVESWTVLRCVRQILDQLDVTPDPLPETVRAQRGVMDLDDALRVVHFPNDKVDIERARDRLRFDEAVALQLVLADRRHDMKGRVTHPCPPSDGALASRFDEMLPFELTDGQKSVAAEIETDLSGHHPMSRLLQGEVGSGKTIVALRAMLQVVDAGYQCALLAPTEVLAAQHYRSLRAMLGPLATAGEIGAAEVATRVELLTGSLSTAAKRRTLLAAVNGDAGIVIGTHALIQDSVEFFDLGMVVVDEQHRFGVEQRDALRAKARDGISPHLLVMTATPIPRTIAMTTLGDLETSTLTELPRGRSPIVTNVVPSKEQPRWVDRAWERITEEVAQGRQAYVVCSRIGDPDKEKIEAEDRAERRRERRPPPPEPVSDGPPVAKSALRMYDDLTVGPLAAVEVGLLHGKLPPDEKDAVMTAFNDGDIDVLVCTTVVEVGVDVPNATVMVISDADRFGVSQLHQLRGRVGRGGNQGLCILLSQISGSSPTMERLRAVAGTNDGFELALLDLKQRREGDILGAAQSGKNTNLRLLSLLEHQDIIEDAQLFARSVIDVDPRLDSHPGLARMKSAAVDIDRLDFLNKS